MNEILRQINTNITSKRIQNIKKNLQDLDKENIKIDQEIQNIDKIYDKLLFRKSPVGSSKNAINYLNTTKK